ncbi:MAG: hypothetical protein ACRCYV_02770 [Aeromonas sp.]
MSIPTIPAVTHSPRVEALLAPYRAALGDDFLAYRGHVYRVLSFAMHFLQQDEQQRALVETALVYHDLGLWTDNELAYLAPSEALVVADNRAYGWGLDDSVLVAAIHWHHKITAYRGVGETVVNAIRRADWIEASQGVVRKGLTRAQIADVQAQIPDHGFAAVLQRLARDLGGSALAGNLKVLKTVFKL